MFVGLGIESNCPGDGFRRYRFVLKNDRPDGTGDLQLGGPFKGPVSAEHWLDGFIAGTTAAKRT